jgi:hypothetical protein
MFPSQLPQLLTDYAAIFTQCSILYFEKLSLLYLSRNVRIRRSCGENLSKRSSVKGHNSSKSTNRKILTNFFVGIIILLCAKFHPNPLGNDTTKVSIDKHTHIQTNFWQTKINIRTNFGSLRMVVRTVWFSGDGMSCNTHSKSKQIFVHKMS